MFTTLQFHFQVQEGEDSASRVGREYEARKTASFLFLSVIIICCLSFSLQKIISSLGHDYNIGS